MLLGNNEYNVLGEKSKENKYEFNYKKETFDINNKMDSHASLARSVKSFTKVLDVGCSTGNLGKILKDFKNCNIDGIEYEKKAFEILKLNQSYTNVYNFSILDNKCKEYIKLKNQKEKYDYIIFGDVLEHLYEPWQAILNACELIKSEGKILVSVPNIAHIDIIKGLINQDFNYNFLGLLDNTHIRFFTEKSFVDMIKNINKNNEYFLSLKVLDRILVKPEYMNDLNFTGINNFEEKIENYYPLQIIFEISKVKSQKQIKYSFNKNNDDFFEEIIRFIINQNTALNRKNNELNEKKNELLQKEQEIIRLVENIKTEFDKYQKLDKDYNFLNTQYLKVINSKGWKILENMRKAKKKIIKK